jgi:hypothetical protein
VSYGVTGSGEVAWVVSGEGTTPARCRLGVVEEESKDQGGHGVVCWVWSDGEMGTKRYYLRPRFACFSLTKIYSKYIKNVGIKLASLKSMFQYKSNNTNFTQYNQVLVSLFIRLKFALECVCTLFLETEVVEGRRKG